MTKSSPTYKPVTLNQKNRSRNLLAYFFETKYWKDYCAKKADNVDHWMLEDPVRAQQMLAYRTKNMKGYSIQDAIYDILDAVHGSHYKHATKIQLYIEIDELEQYHMDLGDLMEFV